MDYKKSYMILNAGVLGGGILAFLSLTTTIMWLGVVGCIAMIGGLLQAFIFYRCPNCKRELTIRGKKPDYCPGCGCKLNF